MRSTQNEIEKPVLGYVVIAVALLVGMITANALGQQETQGSVSTQMTSRKTSEFASIAPTQCRRWVLGVRAEATETGYVIQQVQTSSAASQVGLEAGDRVVSVNGTQVGYVNGRLVSLARTLDKAGGSYGRTQVLVQNRRNRRLVGLVVSLMSPSECLGN